MLNLSDFLFVNTNYLKYTKLINELIDCVKAQDTKSIEVKRQELVDKIRALEIDKSITFATIILNSYYKGNTKCLQADIAKLDSLNDTDITKQVDSSVILYILWNSALKYYFNDNIADFVEKIQPFLQNEDGNIE